MKENKSSARHRDRARDGRARKCTRRHVHALPVAVAANGADHATSEGAWLRYGAGAQRRDITAQMHGNGDFHVVDRQRREDEEFADDVEFADDNNVDHEFKMGVRCDGVEPRLWYGGMARRAR